MNYETILKYKQIMSYVKYVSYTLISLLIIYFIKEWQKAINIILDDFGYEPLPTRAVLAITIFVLIIKFIKLIIKTEKELREMEILQELKKIEQKKTRV